MSSEELFRLDWDIDEHGPGRRENPLASLPINTTSEVPDAVVDQYVFIPPFDIAAVPHESRQQVDADVAKMTSELEKEFNDLVSEEFDSFLSRY